MKKISTLSILVLALTANCVAQDPEHTNFRTGINVTPQGVKGVDYMEEYYFSDKVISDRKTIYIRSSTLLGMTHNERNIARVSYACQVIGANGLDGVPNSGDEGLIRYKVDGDMHNGLRWTDGQGGSVNTAYSGPINFDGLRYTSGVAGGGAVVGRTGTNSAPRTPKSGFYHYGLLDSCGDEWHTIQVADDDWNATPTDVEWRASDGRVLHFIVNPKAPALTIRASGNAQFYTTPPKTYHVPKIFDQTSYILPQSGEVTFELKDLFGNTVFYRINGGSWQSDKNPRIGDHAFRDGENLLEYYYEGRETNKRTRRVVKNPAFPSANERHGLLLFGSPANLNAARARRSIEPYKYHWDRLVSGAGDTGARTSWDGMRRTGRRFPYSQGSLYGAEPSPAALSNAVVALLNGVGAVPSGKSRSFAIYAKEMAMENSRVLDNVGFELHHSGVTLPTRELTYRGYYDVGTTFDLAFAYDILISIFRSDQVAGGITPIEDYYLRDSIANNVVECMQFFSSMQGFDPVTIDTGGMWDVARKCGALVGMFAIPSYSSIYYGTAGLDGNQTVYPFTPFPDVPLTWKKVMLDEDAPLVGYPNLANRLGIEGYNCLADGRFNDKTDYWSHMGRCFMIVMNVLANHYPMKRLPNAELSFRNAALGQLFGTKSGAGGFGPSAILHIGMYNENFPEIATVALPSVRTLVATSANSDDQLINGNVITTLAWYDVNLRLDSGVNAPSELLVR